MIRGMRFLKAAENKPSFFRRVALHFPSLDWRYQLIEQAYDDAEAAHKGATRDDGKTAYFEHIRAVALIILEYLRVKDYEIIIASLLHDIVEDCPEWTIERVRLKYGDRVAQLVQYLTKPFSEYPDKAERERVYHNRFQFAPRDFFLIKLADRFHNLYTLWSCTIEKRRRKIEETRLYYLPYAERELILLHEIEWAIEKVEKAA
jgi:guanosine-3',5'-bis(diphosphate) 3'-pyrophosphohydrolase